MTFAAEGIYKAYNGRAVLTDVGLSVRGGEKMSMLFMPIISSAV